MKKNKSKMIIGKRIVMFIVAICMVGAGGYTRYLVNNEKSRTSLYGSKESKSIYTVIQKLESKRKSILPYRKIFNRRK